MDDVFVLNTNELIMVLKQFPFGPNGPFLWILMCSLFGFSMPLLALVVWFFIREGSFTLWKTITSVTLITQAFLHIYVLSHFAWAGHIIFYKQYWSVDFGPFKSTYSLAITSWSAPFYILVPFILFLCAVTFRPEGKYPKTFFGLLLVTDMILLHGFCSFDLLQFFVLLELSIIPMFLFISVWGSRERRSYSGYTYYYYSMFGSIFLLGAIIVLAQQVGTTSILKLYSHITEEQLLNNSLTPIELNHGAQLFYFILMFAALAIKLPVFPVHTWLPEVHGEASMHGSVILAALYLKLPAIGILTFVLPFFPEAYGICRQAIQVFGLLGFLYGSVILFRVLDIKKFIAYSSVLHMGLFTVTICCPNEAAFTGGFYILVVHTIQSALLFFLAGFIYDRYHTRIVYYMSDLSKRAPTLATMMYIALGANFGFPFTAGFIAEMTALSGIYKVYPLLALLCAMIVSLAAVAHFVFVYRFLNGEKSIDYKYFKKELSKVEKPFVSKDDSMTWDWRSTEFLVALGLIFLVFLMNFIAGVFFFYFFNGASLLATMLGI